jgi:hypothetical protein
MGAVLAMKIAILMLALLAACAQKPAPDLRGLLSRAAIDRSPQPLILAELPSQNVVATLIPRDTLDSVVTWRTGRGQTLSFRDGVLVATRSLGNDLMSADVAGTQAALRGGPQQGYSRLMTYLDGQGQTLFRAMLCGMDAGQPATVNSFGVAFPTTLRIETCFTTGKRVENRYWLNADSTMRRAEQWVGPGTGPLTIEWLSR